MAAVWTSAINTSAQNQGSTTKHAHVWGGDVEVVLLNLRHAHVWTMQCWYKYMGTRGATDTENAVEAAVGTPTRIGESTHASAR
jgi:hypothetical protein